jgi:four helix bundle protein
LVTLPISHTPIDLSISISEVIGMIQISAAQQPAVLYRNSIVQRPPGTFDHHRLDAFHVARDALRLGDAIARRLPRGYAALGDQLRRALLAAYLNIAEASSRQGQDRMARFRCARGEASEAAAAIEAVAVLALAPADQTQVVLDLCDRLCAMLTRLSGAATGPTPPSRPR